MSSLPSMLQSDNRKVAQAEEKRKKRKGANFVVLKLFFKAGKKSCFEALKPELFFQLSNKKFLSALIFFIFSFEKKEFFN